MIDFRFFTREKEILKNGNILVQCLGKLIQTEKRFKWNDLSHLYFHIVDLVIILNWLIIIIQYISLSFFFSIFVLFSCKGVVLYSFSNSARRWWWWWWHVDFKFNYSFVFFLIHAVYHHHYHFCLFIWVLVITFQLDNSVQIWIWKKKKKNIVLFWYDKIFLFPNHTIHTDTYYLLFISILFTSSFLSYEFCFVQNLIQFQWHPCMSFEIFDWFHICFLSLHTCVHVCVSNWKCNRSGDLMTWWIGFKFWN